VLDDPDPMPYRVDRGAFIETPDGEFLDKEEFLARAHRPRLTPEERSEKARRSAELFQDVVAFGESIPDDLRALNRAVDEGHLPPEEPPPAA